jgi:hypothetical protein
MFTMHRNQLQKEQKRIAILDGISELGFLVTMF